MDLYFLRHGEADWPDWKKSDDERPLTKRGKKEMNEVGKFLKRVKADPDLILTSPLLRAKQTAEIACEALGYPVKKLRQTVALKSEAKPTELFDELSGLKAEEVICVGHAPNVDNVVAFVIGSRSPVTALKKAGLASIEIETFSPPRGTIVGIYSSKALRLLTK